MARYTKNGPNVTNTYGGYTVTWYCKQVADITVTDTTVTVVLNIYAHFNDSAHIYGGDCNAALVVDNNVVKRANPTSDNWPSDGEDWHLISYPTITYRRQQTAAPHTISSYVQITGGAWEGTSSTYNNKLTVNVPPLQSYAVSYNASGGSGAPSKQTKYHGQPLTLSNTSPTRVGYDFRGWADSSSSNEVRFRPGGYYYDNISITLYALWQPHSYTLTYNINYSGGTNPSAVTRDYGTTYGSLPSPSRSGYILLGWFTAASGGTQVSSTTTMGAANTTIYAHWQKSYTAPTAKITVAKRCGDSSGAENDAGAYAYIEFNWTLGSETEGTLHYQVFVKTQNSSSYTPVGSRIHISSTSVSSVSPETFISSSAVLNNTDSSYDVKIELYNSSSATSILATATDYISPAYFIMDINAEGTAIGFGTSVSDDNNGFYCNMNATFDQSALFKQGVNISSGQKYKINGTNLSASDVGALASSIVHVTETGSGSGWYWRKWSNGSVEAWGSYTFSSTAGTAWSSGMYYYNATVSIPSGIFPAKPLRAFATSSGDLQWMVAGIYITSATSVTVRLVKPVSSSQSGGVYIYLWY